MYIVYIESRKEMNKSSQLFRQSFSYTIGFIFSCMLKNVANLFKRRLHAVQILLFVCEIVFARLQRSFGHSTRLDRETTVITSILIIT